VLGIGHWSPFRGHLLDTLWSGSQVVSGHRIAFPADNTMKLWTLWTVRLRTAALCEFVKGYKPRPSTNHKSYPWLSPAPFSGARGTRSSQQSHVSVHNSADALAPRALS